MKLYQRLVPVLLIALGATMIPTAWKYHDLFGVFLGLFPLGIGFYLLKIFSGKNTDERE